MMDTSNSDLVFNVAQLLKEPVGSTRKLDLDTPALNLNAADAGRGTLEARNLRGVAIATRLNDGVLVQGSLDADVLLECSRCLEPLTLPIEARLEEEYRPTIDVETGRPVRRLPDEQDDDTTFTVDHNHMIDLNESVRQALLVALPMKPLCREDCAGLCPQCGANLNEADCGHEMEPADSRWAGLEELKLEDFPAGESNN